MAPYSIYAALVLPVAGPPIRNGVVDVGADGRIVAVHDTPPPDGRRPLQIALMPALINAHTHLEFSGLAEPIPPRQPFPRWLNNVIENRQRSSEGLRREAIDRGLRVSRESGVGAIGEIATAGWGVSSDSDPHISVVSFWESIGLSAPRVAAALEGAQTFLADSDIQRPWLRRALSPHAPYTVHPDLLTGLLDLACVHGVPVAMHLAETPDERALLERGSGELAEFLRERKVWNASAFAQPRTILDLLQELSRAPAALVIHGNDLQPPEIDYLASQPRMSVVYCPRTHAYFQRPPHPWRQLAEHGVRVALGTDSLASNPDLSLFEEARFLAASEWPVDPEWLLRSITLHGAEALGLDDDLGSLVAGKLARFAVIRLPQGSTTDHLRAIFHASAVEPVGLTA